MIHRGYPLQIAGLRFSLRGAELELDLERCEKVRHAPNTHRIAVSVSFGLHHSSSISSHFAVTDVTVEIMDQRQFRNRFHSCAANAYM